MTAENDYGNRILEQLLRLREAGALRLTEVAPGRNVHRYLFRAGGWPVSIDLDATVCELRAYHHRDEIVMGHRVGEQVLDILLGRKPYPASGGPRVPEAECLAELARIVAHWKAGNPRIFMQPPVKVGHPDNWNGA
jgi:hypothetical protein